MRLVAAVLLLTLVVLVAYGTALARKPDATEMSNSDKVVEINNPNPVLAGDLVAGFKMTASYILRDSSDGQSEDMVCEKWHKESSLGPTHGTFIKITVYLARSQAEAFEVARAVYGARKQEPKLKTIDTPRIGSYSGQTIGDFCWAYRWSPSDPSGTNRPPKNQASSVVVVAANTVFDVNVSSKNLVEDQFTEAIAKVVVTRLTDWPRPR